MLKGLKPAGTVVCCSISRYDALSYYLSKSCMQVFIGVMLLLHVFKKIFFIYILKWLTVCFLTEGKFMMSSQKISHCE